MSPFPLHRLQLLRGAGGGGERGAGGGGAARLRGAARPRVGRVRARQTLLRHVPLRAADAAQTAAHGRARGGRRVEEEQTRPARV